MKTDMAMNTQRDKTKNKSLLC